MGKGYGLSIAIANMFRVAQSCVFFFLTWRKVGYAEKKISRGANQSIPSRKREREREREKIQAQKREECPHHSFI